MMLFVLHDEEEPEPRNEDKLIHCTGTVICNLIQQYGSQLLKQELKVACRHDTCGIKLQAQHEALTPLDQYSICSLETTAQHKRLPPLNLSMQFSLSTLGQIVSFVRRDPERRMCFRNTDEWVAVTELLDFIQACMYHSATRLNLCTQERNRKESVDCGHRSFRREADHILPCRSRYSRLSRRSASLAVQAWRKSKPPWLCNNTVKRMIGTSACGVSASAAVGY